uniref:endoplasmic reticulum membrane-associated RNA degradation protein-like isoform X1 n=2 Tax=Macaca mulatta TaxID=9544 RepID=UPI0010A263CA|nr:endoplasmic reticulum membrane-associated RNA degradation protein-like isoform X1 [Macaca mulatta]
MNFQKKQLISCLHFLLYCYSDLLMKVYYQFLRLEDNSETNASHSLITKMTDELYHHVPENHCVLKDLDHLPTETPTSDTQLALAPRKLQPCRYRRVRYRIVLEVLVVLQSIGKQCHHMSGQVTIASELRHRQWVERMLRSRQRQNYLRIWSRCALTFLFWRGTVGQEVVTDSVPVPTEDTHSRPLTKPIDRC